MSAKFITLSGIIAAVLSSACCIVPLLAIIAGTSGLASAFSWLEPLRPYLMGLTISMLGFAWYKKLVIPEKKNSCDCELRKSSFWQTKTFLIIITLFAGLLLTFPSYSHIFYPGTKNEKQLVIDRNNIVEAEFKIEGMACEGCADHISNTLSNLSGVIECKTSFEKGNSIVKFDTTKTTTDSIILAVSMLGYEIISKTITDN